MVFWLKLLDFISRMNDKIPSKRKDRILSILFMGYFLCYFFGYELNPSIRFSVITIVGFLITAMMVLVALNTDQKPFVWNKKSVFFLLVLGLSFFSFGVYFHMVGYIAISLLFLVVLPVYYYTAHNNQPKERFPMAFAKGSFYSFVLFLILGFTSGPILEMDQYSSILHNPNGLANYLVVVIPALLYLFFKEEKAIWKYGSLILTGIALVELFFSRSRTGYLIGIALILLFLIVMFINENTKKALKSILLLVIIVALAFPSTFFMLTVAKKWESKQFPQLQLEGYSGKGGGGDVSLEDLLEKGVDRSLKGLSDDGNITSGRSEIWKTYWKEVSFLGHKKEELEVTISYREYASTNAHNVYLQVAYSAGIIAGVAMLLFVLMLCGYSLKYFFIMLKKKRFNLEWMLTTLLFIGFFFNAITTTGYVPYTYPAALGFWYLITEYFIKGERFSA